MFALACLAATTVARSGRRRTLGTTAEGRKLTTGDYVDYLATNGKTYDDSSDFHNHEEEFAAADNIINKCNKHSQESTHHDTAKCAHNKMSDMTAEEMQNHLGLKLPENGHNHHGRRLEHMGEAELSTERARRQLNYMEETIDWVADGKMTAPKEQGTCGACYSFAALSILEAMVAIKQGTSPVRLSEQQIVDCAHSYDNNYAYQLFGCNGGWPGDVWYYGQDHGMIKYDSYVYKSKEMDCSYNGEADVEYKIKSYDVVNGFGYQVDAEDVVWKLKKGPLAAAIQYTNCDQLFYYQSGVLRSEDCTFSGPDHAVVIVAYIPAGNPWTDTYKTWKAVGQRWHNASDPAGACAWDDETYQPDMDKCIQWVQEESTETLDGEAVWVIQNSWGEDWGKSGYAHVAVEDGAGFQGLNLYAHYLDIMDVVN